MGMATWAKDHTYVQDVGSDKELTPENHEIRTLQFLALALDLPVQLQRRIHWQLITTQQIAWGMQLFSLRTYKKAKFFYY